jgi:hypothetical protein
MLQKTLCSATGEVNGIRQQSFRPDPAIDLDADREVIGAFLGGPDGDSVEQVEGAVQEPRRSVAAPSHIETSVRTTESMVEILHILLREHISLVGSDIVSLAGLLPNHSGQNFVCGENPRRIDFSHNLAP